MKLNLFALALLLAVTRGMAEYLYPHNLYWNAFKEKFHKEYDSPEIEKERKAIFFGNVKKINAFNLLYERGIETSTMGINQFTDLSKSERVQLLTCVNMSLAYDTMIEEYLSFKDIDEKDLPSEKNWVKEKGVTHIKDQFERKCSSCWVFSAVGALETQHFLQSKRLVPLSEQNLIDCDGLGCERGCPKKAYEYIINNRGVDKESSYTYTGVVGKTCKFNKKNVGATMATFKNIEKNEVELQKAVAFNGTISVCFDASSDRFEHYKRGVLHIPESECSKRVSTHCAIIVGYGNDGPSRDPYWLVKNSYGTQWGMNGYAMLSRGSNMCGIANFATLPLINFKN